MRKFRKIFALALLFLLAAVSVAWGGMDDYPSTFILSSNGVPISPGATLKIAPGETIILEVVTTSTRSVFVSGDDYIVVGLTDASSTLVGPGTGTVTMHYNPPLSALNITANGVLDGTVYLQLTSEIKGGGGTPFTGPFLSASFPLRLQSGPVTELNYLFVPKSISLTDTEGKSIENIRMEASRTRMIYAVADDYNGNGMLDQGDYDVIPVNDYSMKQSVETGDSEVMTGTSTTPSLLGKTPTMDIYPKRIATLTLKALNEGGDSASDYPVRYTEIFYRINFGGTTGTGVNVSDILPNNGEVETPPVSVAVTALDDAGSGSDGGGTCNTLGLGMLLLAVPALGLFGRRRS